MPKMKPIDLDLPPVKLTLDGGKYCVLAGRNLQEGVAGFGDTVEEAFSAFLVEWEKVIEADFVKRRETNPKAGRRYDPEYLLLDLRLEALGPSPYALLSPEDGRED